MGKDITQAGLIDVLDGMPKGRRLIAIAGAPASGKSWLADRVVEGLNTRAPGRAAVVPMDGFHLDDGVLSARGDLARKGAPHTFDVGGLRHMLRRLRAADESEVMIPLFDRELEIARAGAAVVTPDTDIIVVEGNYLLLGDAPWAGLADLFDLTVMFDVPVGTLRARLEERWTRFGLTPDQITTKIEYNDLPNGDTVRQRSVAADYVVKG